MKIYEIVYVLIQKSSISPANSFVLSAVTELFTNDDQRRLVNAVLQLTQLTDLVLQGTEDQDGSSQNVMMIMMIDLRFTTSSLTISPSFRSHAPGLKINKESAELLANSSTIKFQLAEMRVIRTL